jgi:membrane associated rhomboid family serine protease
VSMLTGSLESPPFGGGSDPAASDHEPSDGALKAIHADGLRLARGRMLLPLVAVALLLAISLVVDRNLARLTLVLAVLLAGWAFRETYDWWMIRRRTPLDAWRAEQREAAEDSAALAENDARLTASVPVVSFGLAGIVTLVTGVQIFGAGIADSIGRAALVKPAVFAGEYWRLLSGVYLHGSAWHFQANIVGLLSFSALIEAYDRRSRVPLAFLVSALAGSVASTLASSTASVGASGGVLGLAAYLLAVGAGPTSAPSWLKRHLAPVFVGAAVLGAIGFLFIDNAAHVGGAAAGFALGAIVKRVRHHDGWAAALDACGWIAALVVIGGAVFTIGRLLAW